MALPANTALDLGEYQCDQPVDDSYYCESITDYSGFVYDKAHHRFVMFGGGHAAMDARDAAGVVERSSGPAPTHRRCART